MREARYHLAQINIARLRAPLTDPRLSDFVAQLDEVNAVADRSAGFIWRLQGDEGNATYLRPYADERIIVNMSVWETPEALRAYVYQADHAQVLRRRREWFEAFDGPFQAMWWLPAGGQPTVGEGKARLDYLRAHGPSVFAFTFRQIFAPEWEAAQPWQPTSATPCPA
jgi:hypothetical protein